MLNPSRMKIVNTVRLRAQRCNGEAGGGGRKEYFNLANTLVYGYSSLLALKVLIVKFIVI